MIISVHLPKTAGTSFLASLEEHFGAALLKDYADLPINTPPESRHRMALEKGRENAGRSFAGIECIHGHFLPVKYLPASKMHETKFVAWLRNPVDRVFSHYHFWRNHHDPASAGALHNKVIAENWSLERFCLGPEVKNLYGQFLWSFPPSNFDFIGITEFYGEDLNYFGRRYLGKELDARNLNVRSADGESSGIDNAFRKKLEEHHAMDMELYEMALARRKARP